MLRTELRPLGEKQDCYLCATQPYPSWSLKFSSNKPGSYHDVTPLGNSTYLVQLNFKAASIKNPIGQKLSKLRM